MKSFEGEKYGCMLHNNCYLVEELTVDIRKGVPQCKFIINVSGDEYWDEDTGELTPIPSELKGLWISDYSYDQNTTKYCDVFEDSWHRAKEVLVTTYEADYD